MPLYATANPSARSRPLKHLLWGDGVRHLDAAASNGRRKVRARATTGWVDEAHLHGQPLLEVYFIDVGQGDGVLLRTPDFRHLLVDGGYPRSSQPSGKSAADFMDWKFARDYGQDTIRLDALIASHNDDQDLQDAGLVLVTRLDRRSTLRNAVTSCCRLGGYPPSCNVDSDGAAS